MTVIVIAEFFIGKFGFVFGSETSSGVHVPVVYQHDEDVPGDETFHRISENHGQSQKNPRPVGLHAPHRKVVQDVSLRVVQKAQISTNPQNRTEHRRQGNALIGDPLPPPPRLVVQRVGHDEGRVLTRHGRAENAQSDEESGVDGIGLHDPADAPVGRHGVLDGRVGRDEDDEDDVGGDADRGSDAETGHVALHGEGEHDEERDQDQYEIPLEQVRAVLVAHDGGHGVLDDEQVGHHGAVGHDEHVEEHEARAELAEGVAGQIFEGENRRGQAAEAGVEGGLLDENAQGFVREEPHEEEEEEAGPETAHAEGVRDADDAGADDGVHQVGRGAEDGGLLLGQRQLAALVFHLGVVRREGAVVAIGAVRAAAAAAAAATVAQGRVVDGGGVVEFRFQGNGSHVVEGSAGIVIYGGRCVGSGLVGNTAWFIVHGPPAGASCCIAVVLYAVGLLLSLTRIGKDVVVPDDHGIKGGMNEVIGLLRI
mmetsp:Transcript_19400/g.40636  ORF Transcript_19400/g.40636 Transcript_19400/m.40636 type:complete len:481 (+) Transcript_19400:1091-2533(+)